MIIKSITTANLFYDNKINYDITMIGTQDILIDVEIVDGPRFGRFPTHWTQLNFPFPLNPIIAKEDLAPCFGLILLPSIFCKNNSNTLEKIC